MLELYPITDQSSYNRALEEIEPLVDLDPPAGSDVAVWLDAMATLVIEFEKREFPIEAK